MIAVEDLAGAPVSRRCRTTTSRALRTTSVSPAAVRNGAALRSSSVNDCDAAIAVVRLALINDCFRP